VNFRVPVNIYGTSTTTLYGTMNFFDPSGQNWGYGTITNNLATTGIISTGYTYTLYFNGTSVWYPESWSVYVPPVTGQSQPANYYTSVTQPSGAPWSVYTIATAYSDSLISSSGALSGAIKANGGSNTMANDTLVHGQWYTYTYTVSVTTPFGARLPSYINPAYPSTGAVQGYVYLITNSTNILASGATAVSLASNTIIFDPISMVIGGASGGTQTVQFSLYLPTSQHITVYGGTVWNVNSQWLINSHPITWAGLTAPTGYTVGSQQLLGNLNAGHTYCLWNVS
jgi:hypothetical protein